MEAIVIWKYLDWNWPGTGSGTGRCISIIIAATVSAVHAQWSSLGLQLGVPEGELDVVKADNPGSVEQCMKAMLQWWLQKYPQKGWSDIVKALEAIDRNDIAQEVAGKYCNSITSSQPTQGKHVRVDIVCLTIILYMYVIWSTGVIWTQNPEFTQDQPCPSTQVLYLVL